ncbi:hypothetical protein BHAOGJBA_1688 [Methylobacterium hispanicum]|uniref:DUF4376 domain-containing protein n=1 Tax=Methylobacterium hispanicum TaxID=270350 RepID=A0AAV4ZI87_9HYPH|nr:DUF4376 domain-containing protein [Methylobacterium hispanicum]GJD88175.1 hypothetical protein BHAOGJBA_1688 [Methylobacterium hispanicum]
MPSTIDPLSDAIFTPEGEAPPGPSVDALCAMVDAEVERRTQAGFACHGHHFQSRPKDQDNIRDAYARASRAAAAGAQIGDIFWYGDGKPFGWIAEDNTLVAMDAQAVIEMGDTMGTRKKDLIFAGTELKARIRAGAVIANVADDALWPA